MLSLNDVSEGEGDLTKRIKIKSNDEIGELSHWFNIFIIKLQNMIADIAQSSRVLSDSTHVTLNHSDKISKSSSNMLNITNEVTDATREMSTGISSVAKLVGQASNNLDIVASSTEKMTATVYEISSNAEMAKNMSNKTAVKIKKVSKKVIEQSAVTEELETFAESINDISD